MPKNSLHFDSKLKNLFLNFLSYSNLEFYIDAIWAQNARHFDSEFVSLSCSNFEFYGRRLYADTECNCIVRYWHRSMDSNVLWSTVEIHRWITLYLLMDYLIKSLICNDVTLNSKCKILLGNIARTWKRYDFCLSKLKNNLISRNSWFFSMYMELIY